MRNIKYLLFCAMCLAFTNANAASIYDNSINAININMLTMEMMENTHRGESLSDFIKGKNLYGEMTRLDEYGDDGTTVTPQVKQSTLASFAKDVWIDGKHMNTRANYGDAGTKRARFYLASVGFDSIDFELPTGTIMFGGFFGYINGAVAGFDTDGQTAGIFARYNYQNLSIGTMLNNGSTKNKFEHSSFNNEWLNVAVDASWKIRLDKTLYLEPGLYFGYNYVETNDETRINGALVSTKNFNFWNISPSVKLVKQISNGLYVGAFTKYTNTSGGKSDITFQNATYNGIGIKDYVDAGLNMEYDYEQFIFELSAKKQMGKFHGWAGDINVRYLF